jgi:hypothetical protein
MLTLTMREVIPAVVLLALGTQIIFASFFISILVSGSKSTSRALRESHVDEKREREEAVARLQAEYNRIQGRLDTMYLDSSGPFELSPAAGFELERDGCDPFAGQNGELAPEQGFEPGPCG